MTPERADSIMNDYVFPIPEAMRGFVPSIRDAILVACAEERRAALTEAAELCRAKALHDYEFAKITPELPRVAMGNRCDDCAQDIEALRDKP